MQVAVDQNAHSKWQNGGFDIEGVTKTPFTNLIIIQLDLLIPVVPYDVSVPVSRVVASKGDIAPISSQGKLVIKEMG